VPPGFLLGVSVGSAEEAVRVRAWPADYWSIGPCFTTANKPDAGPALGPEGFAALARLAPDGMPVIGIGGITPANAATIVRTGAAGVAVMGAVVGAWNPEVAAQALSAAVGPA
jgi:thiamine-phosphate pyrophosphorylase